MSTSYDFRTAWWLHVASPVTIGAVGAGLCLFMGPAPGWAFAVAFAAAAVFILVMVLRTLARAARLTDDAVEVVTAAGTRRIPLADVDRPGRFTRSALMGNNMRMVNVTGGSFAVPGFSRRAAEFLEDLAARTAPGGGTSRRSM